MEKYDLCVIGAGPSGYAAAMRAVDFRKRVILIEKEKLGGAGVHNGALSSKTWWEISREVSVFRKHLNRYHLDSPEVNFEDIKKDVEKAEGERTQLLKHHMDSINELSEHYITFKSGNAKLISYTEVQISSQNGDETIQADYIILATGSRPRMLPNIPVDEETILTSDGIDKLDHFPKSMVVVGAGVIGCEFTTIFSGFGETNVNLIDKGDRILPFEDEDVVKVIEEVMEKNGVLIHRNSKLTDIKVEDGRVEYELTYNDGKVENFNVEKALLSVGRVPNIEGLGLEEIGIKMEERGIWNDDAQTSIPNIYAVGDITADIALVNVGELEARHAVERIFGNPKRKLVYENISTIMFLDPEVAGVGLNEQQAQKMEMDYCVATVTYEYIPRAIAKRDTRGFIKLLVTNDDEKKLLGMRVVGRGASSAIQAVALLISMNKGIEELAECVHPHPSITEGIQECVRVLLGKSLFKPWAFEQKIYCKRFSNGEYEDLVL